jgi:hypothetical protein
MELNIFLYYFLVILYIIKVLIILFILGNQTFIKTKNIRKNILLNSYLYYIYINTYNILYIFIKL